MKTCTTVEFAETNTRTHSAVPHGEAQAGPREGVAERASEGVARGSPVLQERHPAPEFGRHLIVTVERIDSAKL